MDAVTTTTETPDVKLHFLDYWRVIRLRKSLILTVFLLCVISSAFLTYWLPKQYSSVVGLEVQKDAPEINVVGAQQNQSWDPYYLATQFKIITSWSILCQVITNMNPPLTHELAFLAQENDWSLDDTYKALYRKVAVNQTRGTSLIEITVKNPRAELAAQIANKIADTYKEYRLNLWKNTHTAGLGALEMELSTNYTALTNSMAELDKERADLQIPEMNDAGLNTTIDTETIRAYEVRRIEAKADYTDHSNILAKLQAFGTNVLPDAIPTILRGQMDQELVIFVGRLAQAEDGLTEAVKQGFGPGNPQVIAAEEKLVQAKRDYQNKIAGIMGGFEALVAHDKEFLDSITADEDKAKADSNEKAQKYRPYFTLKRQVEEDTRIYEDLKRREVGEKVEAAQPNQNVVVIHDPARTDPRPVSPKPMIIIPCGVFLGLLVGIGLAFFIEYLDTSVKTIDDVERSLQAPVLGVIPQNVGNIMDEGPESPHAEAYRVLRTNLLFSRKDENWNTITVLSGGAGEGKTTTLFNMAVVFAQNGERVLVVDSDLRRPSVHRMLKANNTTGLTDVLLNRQITLDQVIQKTKLPTLDYLPSGKLPSSSMSILGSARMKETVQELKRRYDYVFFDSPPLLGVSDASVLASQMDMVLQVIQYRRYPQPMTLRAKQMIQKVGGNLMGLVLNNINMSQDENYYYYSGYYEYEYRTPKSDPTVVHLPEDAGSAEAPKVEIKKKY